MKIAFTIGYTSKMFHSGIIMYHPIVWEVSDFGEFSDCIRDRENIKSLYKFAKNAHVIPSALALFITYEDHQFTVKLINVREFRKLWEKKYKTKWKFDREL